jgi:predicted LPLAT superfamily acyltransferase
MSSRGAIAEQEGRKDVRDGWTGRTRGGYVGNWVFLMLVRHVGLWCAYLLLVPVAFSFLLFSPKSVKASLEYLRRINYGGRCWLQRILAIYGHFYSFGMTLLDRVALIGGNSARFRVEFDGEAHLRRALDKGKGLVIISAHCGSWEAAANLLGRLSVPVNVVAYEGEAAHIHRLFANALEKKVFSVISLDGSPDGSLNMLSALNRGEIIAMHADRVIHSSPDKTVKVPFLGSFASFPTGPYAVAAVTGAPLIHAFAMRHRTCRYHFYAYPPEYLTFGRRLERHDQFRKWAEVFVARLEHNLQQYPLQWYNFYDFWAKPGRIP